MHAPRTKTRSTHGRPRLGASAIELLVVVLVIGLFIAVLSPAILAARANARKANCADNLKQIGVALAIFEQTYGSYPPGVPNCSKLNWVQGGTQAGAHCAGPNWQMNILAKMEHQDLYQHVKNSMMTQWNAADDTEHEDGHVGRTTPREYICPSAPVMSPEQRLSTYYMERNSKGNYAANFGADDYMSFEDPQKSGAFGVVMLKKFKRKLVISLHDHPSSKGLWKMGNPEGRTVKDFHDGIGYTIAVSEVIGYDSRKDGRGCWTCNAMGSAMFSGKTGPNSKEPDVIAMYSEAIPKGHVLYGSENRKDGHVWAAARSGHPGGVNAMMADVSAYFFNDDIEIEVWRSLLTRSGGEPKISTDTFAAPAEGPEVAPPALGRSTDYDATDSGQMENLVSETSGSASDPDRFEKLFVEGGVPSNPQDYGEHLFWMKPRGAEVDGDSATSSVLVEDAETEKRLDIVGWTFAKQEGAWKIKSAPLPRRE